MSRLVVSVILLGAVGMYLLGAGKAVQDGAAKIRKSAAKIERQMRELK